jgi:hypothetical protein
MNIKTKKGNTMLSLRPHHILDIIRNIGNDREKKPHEYGHLVHKITEEIERDIDQKCKLVVKNDDICISCKMLIEDGICIDILGQLDDRISKQAYNDDLDKRILNFLGISENEIMSIKDYLKIIKQRIDEIIPICVHPKETIEYRKNGLKKGIEKLGI